MMPNRELVEIGEAEALRALNARVTELTQGQREQAKMLRTHIRWHKVALGIIGVLSAPLFSIAGWGASQWRDSSTALSRRECAMVATQTVADARAEHSELRARDKELDERIRVQERELQKVAMHRLDLVREAKPK
jgi:hypothetical protein